MQIKIDIKKLDAIIAKAQPDFAAKIAAKPQKMLDPATKALGTKMVSLAGFDMGAIDVAVGTFCTTWPKVRGVINFGLKFAGWFLPASSVALAKAMMTAINDEIIPAICDSEEETETA